MLSLFFFLSSLSSFPFLPYTLKFLSNTICNALSHSSNHCAGQNPFYATTPYSHCQTRSSTQKQHNTSGPMLKSHSSVHQSDKKQVHTSTTKRAVIKEKEEDDDKERDDEKGKGKGKEEGKGKGNENEDENEHECENQGYEGKGKGADQCTEKEGRAKKGKGNDRQQKEISSTPSFPLSPPPLLFLRTNDNFCTSPSTNPLPTDYGAIFDSYDMEQVVKDFIAMEDDEIRQHIMESIYNNPG